MVQYLVESAESITERALEDALFECVIIINEATTTGLTAAKTDALKAKIASLQDQLEKAAIDRKVKFGPRVAILLDLVAKTVAGSTAGSGLGSLMVAGILNPVLALATGFFTAIAIWFRQGNGLSQAALKPEARAAQLQENLKYVKQIKASLEQIESKLEGKPKEKVQKKIVNAQATQAMIEKRIQLHASATKK